MLDNAKLNLVDGSFSFTVKVKNDGTKKKFYLSSNDILKFCEHLNENRKIRLVTDEHTAIAYILQSLFGEDVINIAENYVFLTADNQLTKKQIMQKCREIHREELESRRCKLYNNVIVKKDGTCRKFLDCYIRFQGKKPNGCVAVWDEEKQLYFTNNNEKFEDYAVTLDKLKEIDEFAYRIVKETLKIRDKEREKKIQQTIKTEQTKTIQVEKTIKEQITITVKETKQLTVEDVFNEILEESPDLQRLQKVDSFAFNIAKQHIIDRLRKLDLNKIRKRTCPYLLHPHTCMLLLRKKKPITVHARQTYVIVPRIRTDCPLSYGLDYPKSYTECWVYQEYGRRKMKK